MKKEYSLMSIIKVDCDILPVDGPLFTYYTTVHILGTIQTPFKGAESVYIVKYKNSCSRVSKKNSVDMFEYIKYSMCCFHTI